MKNFKPPFNLKTSKIKFLREKGLKK